MLEVKNRGYGFMVPIGKMLTQHEEKNDVRVGGVSVFALRSRNTYMDPVFFFLSFWLTL